MSLLTKPVSAEHISVHSKRPAIQCNCCKRTEQAIQQVSTRAWLQAANHIGWRHVQSESFDIDVVCPSCVSDFNNPIRKPIKPIKRASI